MKYFFLSIFLSIFLGCSSSDSHPESIIYGKIAKLSEASGICYINKNDTLFVACDNGILYELDKNGAVLNKKDFSSIKNHDFEGIAYDSKNDLIVVAVEGSDNVLVLDRELKIIKNINVDRIDSEGRLILKKDKKEGLEGISVDSNGKIFLSNQSFKQLPDSDPSVVFNINVIDNSTAQIDQIFNHGYSNIAGLSFHNGYLYMVSDSGNLLIKYDYKNNKIIYQHKVASFSDDIKDISVEGVTFDNDNNIYFADNKDGHIFKYQFNE